jgi:glycosyltransferase involved in cell wall biosynthesis
MNTPVASILRAATRPHGSPLNVLTVSCHERYDTGLAKTGHRFWAVRHPHVKDWDDRFAPLPPNWVRLNIEKGDNQLPPEVDFDVVLSPNKFGAYQLLSRFAHQLHLPIVSLEHTCPMDSWGPRQLAHLKSMRGHMNVFISEWSRAKWGWDEGEATVVHHGIDTNTFSPADHLVDKKKHVLSVVNQFNAPVRAWCVGFDFWQEAVKGLPWLHVGHSLNGWSQAAKSVPDLVRHYREATVFVDTASASPIPTVVLENMACGGITVSRGNGMVPEVIKDGFNGFIRETPESMRALLKEILAKPEDFAYVRENARRTILERFSLENFVSNWDRVLRQAAAITYKGLP